MAKPQRKLHNMTLRRADTENVIPSLHQTKKQNYQNQSTTLKLHIVEIKWGNSEN